MTTYIHPSSADGGDCPYRDERYRTGDWFKVSAPYFMRGTMVHGARKWALARYLAEGELPDEDEVVDSGYEQGDARNEEEGEKGGVPLDVAEMREARDEAAPMILTDRRIVLPRIAPHVVAIEERLEVDLGDDIVLTGQIDARGRDPVTDAYTIDDLKTAKKAPSSQDILRAAISPQLSLYAVLCNAHFGHVPRQSLTYVWTGKRKPSAADIEAKNLRVTELPGKLVGLSRTVPTSRSADDLRAALLRVKARIQREKAELFPPAPASGITIPCMNCAHWGHKDPSQRCPFNPTERPST